MLDKKTIQKPKAQKPYESGGSAGVRTPCKPPLSESRELGETVVLTGKH